MNGTTGGDILWLGNANVSKPVAQNVNSGLPGLAWLPAGMLHADPKPFRNADRMPWCLWSGGLPRPSLENMDENHEADVQHAPHDQNPAFHRPCA